jgi:hypothetical protein
VNDAPDPVKEQPLDVEERIGRRICDFACCKQYKEMEM